MIFDIKEIKLSDNLKIWKTNFDINNINNLLKNTSEIVAKNKDSKTDSYGVVFERKIITSDFLNLPNITHLHTLTNYAANACIFLNNKLFNKIYIESWVNVLKSKNPIQKNYDKNGNLIFHNHVDLNDKFNHPFPNYTFICYIQMPDNLINTDGMLSLKDKEGNIFSILPNVGEIIILNGDINHVPNYSPHSTKDRIVLAGNIKITLTKKDKSII